MTFQCMNREIPDKKTFKVITQENIMQSIYITKNSDYEIQKKS